VKNILIGAWSANVFLQNPLFKKENKLVITGGDAYRYDPGLPGKRYLGNHPDE